MAKSQIFRTGNTLSFAGSFGLQDLHRPLAALYQAVQEAGYPDIILDFSRCNAAFPAAMLALCAQVTKLRRAQIDIDLKLPEDTKLRRLFQNANWAHYIAPRFYDPSTFRGYTQVPATQYTSSEDQSKAVNRIVNAILGAIPEMERKDFSALEWAINELTDNVLVHSESTVGGFVQVSTFVRNEKRVTFIVADAGIGILATLKRGHPELANDADALDRAIREGITRDKSVGQGNGLFGSYQICSHSNGFFQVESRYGKLVFDARRGLHVNLEKVPYDGTLIVMEVDFSIPHLLEEALKIAGRTHGPTDYVEISYEDEGSEQVTFRVAKETTSFGSRISGTPMRNKLVNLLRMCPTQRIAIDFSDVALISSSFADEFIAKLFVELGPMTFMSRFIIKGTSVTVQALIDKAISQRVRDTNVPPTSDRR